MIQDALKKFLFSLVSKPQDLCMEVVDHHYRANEIFIEPIVVSRKMPAGTGCRVELPFKSGCSDEESRERVHS
jgi:hypothetical protein